MLKNKIVVTIAGIAIALSASATTTKLPSEFRIQEPLPNRIEHTSSQILNVSKSQQLLDYTQRIDSLENSIERHGKANMDQMAIELWDQMLWGAASLPFKKAFAQYDRTTNSIFYAFDFKNDLKLDATMYVNSEDQYVYFTIASSEEVYYQNALPKEIFFEKARNSFLKNE